MTEQEWLTCADPQKMLGFLSGHISDRKLRLFAVACCRQIWHLLPDLRSRDAVEVAERIAEGTATNEVEGRAASENAEAAMRDAAPISSRIHAAHAAFYAVTILIHVYICQLIINEVTQSLEYLFDETVTEETYTAAMSVYDTFRELLREIIGPLRPITINPAWQTATVISLARAIYQERAFDRLPILADALEDACCTNADILNHCRHPGVHTRGCWVLDMVLGKE